MDKDKAYCLSLALSHQIFSIFGTSPLAKAARESACAILCNGGLDIDLPQISEKIIKEGNLSFSTDTQFLLARLNEKETRRKKDGVFYTDSDVADFITANAFYQYFEPKASDVLPFDKVCAILKHYNCNSTPTFLKISVFDPTVGTGEFLLSSIALRVKSLRNKCSESDIISIVSNTYGNDISKESEMLSQLRILLFSLPYISTVYGIRKLTKILLTNFYNCDFILKYTEINRKFDIIIGNPPYVEYSNMSTKPEPKLGNIYANALHNACTMIKQRAAIGFIVPLSIVSTTRMLPLREYLEKHLKSISYLSFADRPDCLFSGVHQKLTIVIANNIVNHPRVLSSSYQYWYKAERENLFSNISLCDITNITSPCIPKIGNKVESDIYKKVICHEDKDRLLTILTQTSCCGNESPIFLNMRGCFWMKAFDKSPGSKEYKQYSLPLGLREYVLCILNSSLFFLYWIMISDCWHITNKELNNFKIQGNKSYDVFIQLWNNLSARLEETKVFVGTAQTQYEYKHKFCKDIIDLIDEELSKLYHLTSEELIYIRHFALKYRLGDGA